MNNTGLIKSGVKVSEEHAQDLIREYEMQNLYPEIVGSQLMLTDEIPIEIHPPRSGERFPSVILYNEKAQPFIQMFNAEIHLTADDIAFTTKVGGWAVSYDIGDEDENPELEPQDDEDGVTIQILGMEGSGEEEEQPRQDGSGSWKWVEGENGNYVKVRI